MVNEARPLRTVAFVPASKERIARDLAAAGADAIVLDLEDGTPAPHKPAARKLARRLVEELSAEGVVMIVRVNGLDTGETGNDLEAVVCPQLHAIFLPKAGGAKDVVRISALLEFFERRSGVPQGHTLVTPLMETASAIKHAYETGCASPRVAYMGGAIAKDGDQARAIGYEWTPQGLETLFIRSKVLIDARAAGVPYPIGGLWTAIHDLDGLRKFAAETRRLGYTGMMCGHYPSHIPIVNEVFSPSPEEIKHHEEVIALVEAGERRGDAMQEKDGHIVDAAMVKTARVRLDLAKRLGLLKE